MKKIAIVYFSLEGNTKLLAEKIATKSGADLIELRPQKPYPTGKASKYFFGGKAATFKEKPALEKYNFSAADYDTVVIGSPLWAWTVTPPIRTFLSENDLSQKNVAAFFSCGGGNTRKAFDAIKQELRGDLAAELTVVNPLKNPDAVDAQIAEFLKALE